MALVGNTISNIFDNTAPAGPQSIFGGVGGWQNRLIAAGMGLLSGDDWQSQLRGGFGGYLQGAQQDKADKKERDLEAAVKGVTSDTEFMQGIPASIAPLLTAKPELLGSIITARLKDPAKREIRNDSNGVPRYVDSGDAVFADDNSSGGGTPFFAGKSVEAQGLNYLIDQGVLTKEQASQVAAGKTVTGPNGEIIFMTPQGIFAQPAGVGAAAPSGGGNIAITGPKASEDMRKASGFAERADAADTILSDANITAAGRDLANNLSAGIPIAGNYMVPKEYQQFDQAQRDFINAVLRRESGAAIAESEFDNARKQYFPQPGDSPEVIQQKAANRALAIQSLRKSGEPVAPFAGAGGGSGGGGWTDLGNGVRIRRMD